MKRLFSTVILLVFVSILKVQGQDTTHIATKEAVEELKGAFEGMNETMLEMKSTLDALKKIKVSGYIQAQYQAAEGKGISTFAGGNFPAGVRDRFQVRRGRLKVNYDNDLTQYVLQIDVTQNGVIEGIEKLLAETNDPVVRLKIFTMN